MVYLAEYNIYGVFLREKVYRCKIAADVDDFKTGLIDE